MKAIFSSFIDGDPLKLVHLSNRFRLAEGAKPFQAEDTCKAEARNISVYAGKMVKVKHS